MRKRAKQGGDVKITTEELVDTKENGTVSLYRMLNPAGAQL
jgi:hypothetical protein